MKCIRDFNAVELIEETHTYKVRNFPHLRFSSATSFVERHFKPFNSEVIAANLLQYPKYEDRTVPDILEEWAGLAQEGTYVHNVLEAYAPHDADKETLKAEQIVESLKLGASNKHLKAVHGMNYLDYILKPHYELFLEVRLYSERYQICGTADLLIHDPETGLWALVDWKTNRKINKSAFEYPYKGSARPTRYLTDCNFEHYTLQLTLYRYLLETEYGIKIDSNRIVHLRPKPTKMYPLGVQEYVLDYYYHELHRMLEYREHLKEQRELFDYELSES